MQQNSLSPTPSLKQNSPIPLLPLLVQNYLTPVFNHYTKEVLQQNWLTHCMIFTSIDKKGSFVIKFCCILCCCVGYTVHPVHLGKFCLFTSVVSCCVQNE